MSTLVGLLLGVAAIVALLLWATRNLNGKGNRCRDCLADLDLYPHRSNCKQWRD